VNALPRLEQEPPPGYVAFVARNLDTVRAEATRMVGDEHAADRLYPDALTDVAMRWSWLELQRRRMRRRGVAEQYLSRALVRRWQAEQARAERARAEEPEGADIDIRVLRPNEPPPRWFGASASAAVRLAPQMASTARPSFGPVADAAIAWWHAYETRRRRRWIALAAGTIVLVLMLVRLQGNVDDAASLVVLGTGWLRARRPVCAGARRRR
jgi:hypothetical protein